MITQILTITILSVACVDMEPDDGLRDADFEPVIDEAAQDVPNALVEAAAKPVKCVGGDYFSGKLPITLTGDTTQEVDSIQAPSVCGLVSVGTGGRDAIHSYKVRTTGIYHIDTIGSSFDTVLYIGDCAADLLACNNDAPNAFPQSALDVQLTKGQQVNIVVDGFDESAFGPYTLNIALLLPN